MNKTKIFFGGVVCLLIVVAFSFFVNNNPKLVSASVAQGNEYQSTTTDKTWETNSIRVLNSVPGALAQVTVTTSGGNTLDIYDATTTNATLRTNTATTTLAHFQTVGTNETFTFDAIYRYGLIVQTSTTNVASSTITWR